MLAALVAVLLVGPARADEGDPRPVVPPSPDCVADMPPQPKEAPIVYGDPWPGGVLHHTWGSWENCNAQMWSISDQWIRDGYGLGYGGLSYAVQPNDVGHRFMIQVQACNEFGCTLALSNEVLVTEPPPPPAACRDGADNDGDGLVDYGSDPGCVSPDDNDEYNPPAGGGASCDGSPGAYLYAGVSFTGNCLRVTQHTPDLGAWSNVASSLKIVGDYVVLLAQDPSYGGAWDAFDKSVGNLAGTRLGNGTVTSVSIVPGSEVPYWASVVLSPDAPAAPAPGGAQRAGAGEQIAGAGCALVWDIQQGKHPHLGFTTFKYVLMVKFCWNGAKVTEIRSVERNFREVGAQGLPFPFNKFLRYREETVVWEPGVANQTETLFHWESNVYSCWTTKGCVFDVVRPYVKMRLRGNGAADCKVPRWETWHKCYRKEIAP